MLHFFHLYVSEAWRARHIHGWLALSGPWTGGRSGKSSTSRLRTLTETMTPACLVGWWVGWWVGGLVGWWVGRLVGWSVGRLVRWPDGRLVGWSVGRLLGFLNPFLTLGIWVNWYISSRHNAFKGSGFRTRNAHPNKLMLNDSHNTSRLSWASCNGKLKWSSVESEPYGKVMSHNDPQWPPVISR